MGHASKLWGYIDANDDFAEENALALAALPSEAADAARLPLLTREMFAAPQRGYLDQLVTFGRFYNGVEQHWAQWRAAFEALLRSLEWDEAHVWIETELWGDYHCSWKRVRLEQLSAEEVTLPTPEVRMWDYRGPRGNYLRG